MIYAIINKLENDSELKTLLGITDVDNRIYPFNTANEGTCLVYNDSPVTGGSVKENRLELRIIDNDYDHMLQVEKAVLRLLDLEESEPGFIYNNINILSSSLNGGGTLESEATGYTERILNFQIKWRWI